MNAFNHPFQTAADVLAMLEQATMPTTRKRDMRSAMNRICVMASCSPETLRV